MALYLQQVRESRQAAGNRRAGLLHLPVLGADNDSPVCWKKMQIMNPCEVCGDWERGTAWS